MLELTEMANLWTLAYSTPETLDENLPHFIRQLDPSGVPLEGHLKLGLSQVRPLPALLWDRPMGKLERRRGSCKAKGLLAEYLGLDKLPSGCRT